MNLQELLETKGQDGDIVIVENSIGEKHTALFSIHATRPIIKYFTPSCLYDRIEDVSGLNYCNHKPLLLLRADLRPETLLKGQNEGPLDFSQPYFDIQFAIIWRAECKETALTDSEKIDNVLKYLLELGGGTNVTVRIRELLK